MNERVPTEARVDGAVGVAEVGPTVLARGGLTRIDYVDHFAVGPVDGNAASPEQWARAMFGDVASAGEWFIWRGLLQLRLSRGRSQSSVAGWRIDERGKDWIRLKTDSWALSANLVVRATDTEVSLTTLIRYDRRLGISVFWRMLSAVHRRLAPGLLRDAVSTVAETPVADPTTSAGPSSTPPAAAHRGS